MTPEAHRIAIAEACGWRDIKRNKRGYLKGSPRPWAYNQSVPDYLNDLNAMHEAEANLEAYERVRFVEELLEIAGVDSIPGVKDFLAIHATAVQRAEAFLRTIGKWQEEGSK